MWQRSTDEHDVERAEFFVEDLPAPQQSEIVVGLPPVVLETQGLSPDNRSTENLQSNECDESFWPVENVSHDSHEVGALVEAGYDDVIDLECGQVSAGSIDEYDAAIWHTMDILQRLNRNDMAGREPVLVDFEPIYGASEQIVATGNFDLWEETQWGETVEDGSGWTAIDVGQLTVSTIGFYLETDDAVNPWDYGSIVAAELAGPGRVYLTGTSQRGTVCWLLTSIWAELVFVLWARARHPQHPQLVKHDWIPDGWVERIAEAGLSPAAAARVPDNPRSHYDVLEVSATASPAIIHAAFRVRAKAVHPDKGGSAAEMAQVNEAYRVLSDVNLREQYDREHLF